MFELVKKDRDEHPEFITIVLNSLQVRKNNKEANGRKRKFKQVRLTHELFKLEKNQDFGGSNRGDGNI